MDSSRDVSCFAFHDLCHTQTRTIGSCILFGRQAFDVFSATDRDFYGSFFYNRATKVILTHWPLDEKLGALR